jgi:hypothetical protein
VKRAIEEMIAADADEVVLEAEVTNSGALALYRNLGFLRDKRLIRCAPCIPCMPCLVSATACWLRGRWMLCTVQRDCLECVAQQKVMNKIITA